MNAQPATTFNDRLRQHPNCRELALNPNYFQDRMLASVARPSTVAGETAILRGLAEQTDRELSELRTELSELRRTLAGLQVRRAGNDDDLRPQASRPRIEIPPSVRRRRKVQR